VLQVNVADEQLDIAINDAFQYWNERSHFLGTEHVFLTFPVEPAFRDHFRSFSHNLTEQNGLGPRVHAPGMVEELLIIQTPGTKYPIDPEPAHRQPPVTAVELETQS
jgi:hypothetical protein